MGFPKLYFPNTGVSPSVTVTVALAVNPAVTASFTVTQQELDPTAAPLNVLDVRNAAWGSLTWASDHYLTRYREYLNSPQLFGPTGKVKTGRVTISGPTAGASFSGAIPDSYAYVHAGGQPAHYSQSVHNAVNEWFDAYGKERLLVYVVDNALINPFKDGTLKTVLSRLNVVYKTTNGAPRISTTASSTTKLYQYIMVDGPFGAVPTTDLTNVGWYWDAVSSTADGLNGNMIKLLEDAGGNAYLFIDPENNLMFLGESNIFDLTQATAAVMAGGADKIADVKMRQRSVFLANLQAWLLNAAQYGTGWTDMFLLPGTAAYDRVTEKAGKTPVQLYDAAKEKNAFRQ